MIKVGVVSLMEKRAAVFCAKPNITVMLQLCKVFLTVGGG